MNCLAYGVLVFQISFKLGKTGHSLYFCIIYWANGTIESLKICIHSKDSYTYSYMCTENSGMVHKKLNVS